MIENGATVGPLGTAQVAAAITAGRVGGATLLWTAGMVNWTPASAVPALAAALRGATPPLPPPVA